MNLTQRQQFILIWICHGYTRKRISSHMNRSGKIVDAEVGKIRKKLAIRPHLDPIPIMVRWAVRNGMIDKIKQNETQPREGEIALKEFKINESRRLNLEPSAIHMRIKRGKYKGQIKFRRVNARVIFVTVNERTAV